MEFRLKLMYLNYLAVNLAALSLTNWLVSSLKGTPSLTQMWKQFLVVDEILKLIKLSPLTVA